MRKFVPAWRVEKCGYCKGNGSVAVIDGKWLRTVRRRADVSLRSVARSLKYSAAFLSDVELNRRRCNQKIQAFYEKIVQAMNRDVQ